MVKAKADKNNLYSIINIEAAHAAMRDLQEVKAGFMLWYYLAENQNNYECALSSAHFMNETGCKIKAYNAAVEALIEKGYLVPQNDGNHFIFYEKRLMPPKDKNDNKNIMTAGNDTYPLKAQATYALRDDYLSFESIRNITDNTIDNTNNTFSGKPRKITLKEAREILATSIEECWFDNGKLVFESGEEIEIEG